MSSGPRCLALPIAAACCTLEQERARESGRIVRIDAVDLPQGPRSCIGQNLATLNYTATLALLLARFTFELPKEVRERLHGFRLLECRITASRAGCCDAGTRSPEEGEAGTAGGAS